MKRFLVAGVLILTACSVASENYDASMEACGEALSKGSIAPPWSTIDMYFSYSDDAPPTYYKMNQSEYRDQSIAPYFGFGFNNVDDPEAATFNIRAVVSLEDLVPEPGENILYSNEACALGEMRGRIDFRFHSRSISAHPNLAGRCAASYMLYFIGVSPTIADSLVIHSQRGRQLVDAGAWDVVVQELDQDRVSVGVNRSGPFFGCLFEGLVERQQ